MIQVLSLYHYCNLGHNNLEVYNVLVQVQFDTSKTQLDFQYKKLGIRVVSLDPELSERLKILSNAEKFYLTAIKYSPRKSKLISL